MAWHSTHPPPPPIPIRTVNSPFTIVFGGGRGMRAPGSITMSPARAAGCPPIMTMPLPPSGMGVTFEEGPCGVPVHAGGGAFGIGQVCTSVMRHAGIPPMRTVGQPAPVRGEPCCVTSPTRAAGLPTVSSRLYQRSRLSATDQQSVPDHSVPHGSHPDHRERHRKQEVTHSGSSPPDPLEASRLHAVEHIRAGRLDQDWNRVKQEPSLGHPVSFFSRNLCRRRRDRCPGFDESLSTLHRLKTTSDIAGSASRASATHREVRRGALSDSRMAGASGGPSHCRWLRLRHRRQRAQQSLPLGTRDSAR
jgi:hypothetical protein